MTFDRRKVLHLMGATATAVAMPHVARADVWPSKPIHLVVGFAPGGSTDIAGRLIGQWLQERLGQPVVIDNKPGAATNLATEAVVRSPADGYTLTMIGPSATVNATLYDNLSFVFLRDIAPVGSIARQAQVLVAGPSLPAKTVPELIAYAKANPGKVTIGSAGIGSAGHLMGELFKMMAGLNCLHIPYRGAAPLMNDLLGGDVMMSFSGMTGVIQYIKGGQLRALGVTPAERVAALPDVPTIGEFVPGYEAQDWLGMGAPKGTPPEIVDRLNTEIIAAFGDAKFKERLDTLGIAPFPLKPAEFGKFLADETDKWGKVVRAANIKPE
jgi:tripartite-type tricarboxylate transporter receptor subunit TctC